MRTKYKQWAVDYLPEHPEIVMEVFKADDPFFNNKLIAFEVGSGKGDFINTLSKEHLDVHYLAIERCKTVAGILAKKLNDNEVQNVKVFPNDAWLIFNELKEGFVDTIYLNFVDPWPKKRHEKRRLTYIAFLEQYYRILKKGGELIFKSDNDGLYEYTLEELKKTKFVMVDNKENYDFDASNDAMTEYENKFRQNGKSIHRIILKK